MKIGRKLKGVATLLMFVAAVGAVTAFSSAVLTTYSVTRLSSYWTTTQNFDSTNVGMTGGRVMMYLSGDSSWIGDVVYLSAKNTIKHDTILTNYNKVAGVVVGGTRTSTQAAADSASVGTLAATNGQRVWVLVQGRAWVTVDTQAGIAPGLTVIPSNRQGQRGRVAAKTTAIDSFYRALGRIVDTGVIGTKRLINVNVR